MRSLIIVFLSLLSCVVGAQTITGKTSTNGDALPYVNVYLKGTQKGAVSNDDGVFSFKNVLPCSKYW